MYPEAGYTFDGTATTLPESLGGFVKMLGVPVVMITTYGAFARDPLYNGLQLRRVKVSAKEEYLLSAEDTKNLSADEINEIIKEKFSFDNFRWQQENKIKIAEPFRADHPFYAIKNDARVCFTPHMSWGAYESRVRCLNVICSNIKAFFDGKLQNRVEI
jgi:hypothetical protein